MNLLPYNVFGSTIKKICSGSVAGAMLFQKADFFHFLISICICSLSCSKGLVYVRKSRNLR